ncbi:hypothetical protein QCA50_006263 [Cerrena zonata]|uniref:Uncharacterized protein n=1 Tax=Cerrena zonata TaxID=2478898 RepID=A0AAW0GIX4_9APHY
MFLNTAHVELCTFIYAHLVFNCDNFTTHSLYTCQHFALSYYLTVPPSIQVPPVYPWPSFMSHANDLRYFHLDGEWAVDSPLSLFCPSLLSLKLQLSKIRPNLSLREVTGALTCMTSLKYLSLSSIFDFRNPFQANSVSLPIHLPQLVHLTVSGSVANSAALLKHLKLVSLTSLRVNAMGYDSFLEVNSLCSVVADTIEGSPLFPSLARINLTHRRGMKELNAGESDSVCSKPHRFSQPRSLTFLHVHIHNLAIDFPNDVDLTALISRLNLSKLQQLDLDITMPCPSIAIFSRLTTVTTLRIWGETLMDLPMIMSFQSITAFPALKRLEIRHVVADDDPETVQYESCPNELHEVFKLRCQDSSTPFELCFGQCIYPPQEICEAIIAGIFSAYENCIQPGGTRIDAQALNNVSMICDASGHAVRKEDFTWMEDWTNIMMVSSITFKFQATQD